MPKPHSLPTILDDVLRLSLKSLKRDGFLTNNLHKQGVSRWTENGEQVASITIVVNTKDSMPYIGLDYYHKGKSRNYKVDLVAIKSNLGKGKIWYFACPKTNKLCRMLYLINGYFLHREAYNGCMYECQTYSHKTRNLMQVYKPFFNTERIYKELNKKHLKKYYAGKITKRYSRLLRQSKEAEQFKGQDITTMLLMK